ncbi:Rha family transcriptional regulator [Lysinibacillus irui]|uniref:Rha family transcriptional regulator n=2 Tax=Lysinibacillus irui TaxID=2998077 RepID=A0ABU5NMF6_9BACI|nr:Rha family transcriptional regulator [Lysinibacillus irui]MEA0555601.1 Rha family transcriptional regulator [Lysinibacillus irui]MEA0977186.1 Rha family transcriptional regulator [Lysinibacillus irui]MEA1043340.1 Rha family transcriptional regulator [Lysinibacillus irui]
MELVFVENNEVVTDSLTIAEMFGKRHDNVVADIRTQIEYAGEEFSLLNFQESNFKSRGKQYPKFNLTEEAFTLVVFSYNTKEAVQTKIKFIKEFKRIKEFIQNQAASSSNAIDFEKQLIGVKYATEILRVDEPSKIRMLTEAHKQHGVPTSHLPDYVDEELKVSLTQLLKEHGVKMSAAKVNTRLIELGLLEIKERPSSKGGTKEFKSLTEAGRKYGENAISPYNAKETQPLYYPSMFNELLGLLLEKEVS